MTNALIYHLLLICCLASLFLGKRWVFFALALLGPMVQILPSPYGFMVSPVNAILLGLGGLMLRADRESRPAGGVPNLKIMALWTLVLFAGVLRTVLNPPEVIAYLFDPWQMVRTGWYWTTPFIIYFMIYRLVTTRDLARRIIMVCMASSLLEAILAMHERLQGVGRATAHLEEANRAGAYFSGLVVLFFSFVLIQEGRRRFIFLLAWVMAVGALFATLSRGGMLAASLGSTLVFMAFFTFSKQKSLGTKLKYVMLAVLIAANAVLVIPPRVMDRLLLTVGADKETPEVIDPMSEEALDSSSADRLALWRGGLTLMAEQPSGYGAYTSIPLQARFRGQGKAMHNIYIQVLVEHGVQGLACLLLLIGTVGWTLWRRFRLCGEQAEDSALFLGLFGYWVALCVAHFFVNPFFMLQLNGQFWVMSACALRNGAGSRDAA